MTTEQWYDSEDHTPDVICEVEVEGGKKIEARYILGNWETLDGQPLFGVKRWRFLYYLVRTAVYKAPFEI